ncbi:MAG: glycosyltransferase family 4 protein [Gammaproteobacteria bacterium]|nr:glycosyltransferase family 4 protein [Gammaproteobacteria bacterium]
MQRLGLEVTVAFAHDGECLDEYRNLGCAVVVEPHRNWLRRSATHSFSKDVVAELWAARSLARLIRQVAPSLVYINTVASLAAASAARLAGAPAIWHLRELFADVGGEMQAPRWAMPFVRRLISSHAAGLVANSHFVARNLLGPRFADRAVVIPNAVGEEFLRCELTVEQARQRLGLPLAGALIGIPGTLRAVKGHAFFFTALEGWLASRPDLHVLVSGATDTTCAAELQDQVAALGLASRVTFAGSIADMAAFYRACDLVCVPSRAEPFGRVVIESFASGVPVVATGVGGIQEILRDGENGRWCEHGDAPEFERAVRRCLDCPEDARRMAKQARRDAQSRYSQQAHESMLIDQIRKVAST